MADYDKVILPGQEGKIGIKITGFKIHPGRFKKSFTVATNDPENQKVVLYVTGVVKKVFEFSKSLNLSGFAGEKLELESIISIQLPEAIAFTGWHWSEKSRDYDFLCDNLGIDMLTMEAGKRFSLKVWTRGEVKPGNYGGDLILETDFKDIPEKSVMFRLTITPDVQATPSNVIMKEMRIAEGTTKNFEKIVSVIATRGDTLRILEVIPDREDITVNVRETRPGKAFSCVVSIRPPAESGKYQGSVTFVTNYKGYERITVPITGMVRSVPEN
ncbi:MAG: hypothetical protein JW814_05155 [Candidatus Krumholzibacteriota bacterium]|nr:hypothetical protein [Candidatus Krumholzibacteriota bacterium]